MKISTPILAVLLISQLTACENSESDDATGGSAKEQATSYYRLIEHAELTFQLDNITTQQQALEAVSARIQDGLSEQDVNLRASYSYDSANNLKDIEVFTNVESPDYLSLSQKLTYTNNFDNNQKLESHTSNSEAYKYIDNTQVLTRNTRVTTSWSGEVATGYLREVDRYSTATGDVSSTSSNIVYTPTDLNKLSTSTNTNGEEPIIVHERSYFANGLQHTSKNYSASTGDLTLESVREYIDKTIVTVYVTRYRDNVESSKTTVTYIFNAETMSTMKVEFNNVDNDVVVGIFSYGITSSCGDHADLRTNFFSLLTPICINNNTYAD